MDPSDGGRPRRPGDQVKRGPASASTGTGAVRVATHWSRTSFGWAMNLDGSDATVELTLPRVEVRASPRGWESACFLADGRQTPWSLPFPGGVAATLAEALARARRLMPAHEFFALRG